MKYSTNLLIERIKGNNFQTYFENKIFYNSMDPSRFISYFDEQSIEFEKEIKEIQNSIKKDCSFIIKIHLHNGPLTTKTGYVFLSIKEDNFDVCSESKELFNFVFTSIESKKEDGVIVLYLNEHFVTTREENNKIAFKQNQFKNSCFLEKSIKSTQPNNKFKSGILSVFSSKQLSRHLSSSTKIDDLDFPLKTKTTKSDLRDVIQKERSSNKVKSFNFKNVSLSEDSDSFISKQKAPKHKELKKKEEQFIKKKEEFKQKFEELKEKENQLIKIENELKEKELNEKEKKLKREKELKEKEDQLIKKEKELKEKENELKEKAKKLKEREIEAIDKGMFADSELFNFSSQKKLEEENAKLKLSLKEKDREIEILKLKNQSLQFQNESKYFQIKLLKEKSQKSTVNNNVQN